MVYKITLAWLSGFLLGLIAISLAFHITIDDLRSLILSISHMTNDNQGGTIVYRVIFNDIEEVKPIKKCEEAKSLPNKLIIKPYIYI
mgnify:CR=1 FL=1